MTTSTAPEALTETEVAPTRAWRVVAEREVSTRIREKAFVISVLVLVVGTIASIVLFSFLGGRSTTHKVAVTDDTTARMVSNASAIIEKSSDGSKAEPKDFVSVEAAEKAVRDGDVDAALLPTGAGFEVVGEDEVDGSLSSALSSAAASQSLERNAQEQGVDLGALQQNTKVGERLLGVDVESAGERKLVSFFFVLLFYFTAVGFGMTIAQSVTQEKESRIVEILAAAVPIRSLLWGKVIGNTVLALGQIVLLVVAGVAAMAAMGETDLLGLVGPAIFWYVVFFVIGFVALSSLWAVAGSLASRQQDLGSTTMPANILLFAPYMLVVVGGEGVKAVVSMLPIVSAMVMPSRMAEGAVPAWQIGIAVIANLVATVLLVRLGARVYERTLLQTDRKIGFREALRISE